MPRDEIPVPRIDLPDDWEPEGILCARVPLPDHPDYLPMLIGLIDQLKLSRSYERDPTKTGAATVARTWERALNTMPIIIINCEGDEMPTILRDDPSDPCKVQQSIDNGATWSHAFTKGCDDVVIPTPTDEAAEGAGNFMANLFVHITELLDAAPDMPTFQGEFCDWLDTIGVTLDPGEFGDCDEAGDALWFAWGTIGAPTQAEMLDPCTYVDKFEELQSCFDEDGVINWLGCASDTLYQWLQDASNDLMTQLIQTARAITGSSPQNASDYAGGGGGAGFGGDCATGEFGCTEFTETAGGYVRTGSYGVYQPGFGWKATVKPDGNYEVDITKTGGFPAGDVADVTVAWEPTGQGKHIEVWINGSLECQVDGGSAGYRQLQCVWGTGPITSIRILSRQNALNTSLRIIRVCLTPV